jgi:hypothetical protein
MPRALAVMVQLDELGIRHDVPTNAKEDTPVASEIKTSRGSFIAVIFVVAYVWPAGRPAGGPTSTGPVRVTLSAASAGALEFSEFPKLTGKDGFLAELVAGVRQG